MTELIIQDTTLQGIADSIRSKTGRTASIPVPNMSSEIDTIPGVVTGIITTNESGLSIINFTCPFNPSSIFIHLYYPEATGDTYFDSDTFPSSSSGRTEYISELEYDGTHFYAAYLYSNNKIRHGMIDRVVNGNWKKPTYNYNVSLKLVQINITNQILDILDPGTGSSTLVTYALIPNATFRWVAIE